MASEGLKARLVPKFNGNGDPVYETDPQTGRQRLAREIRYGEEFTLFEEIVLNAGVGNYDLFNPATTGRLRNWKSQRSHAAPQAFALFEHLIVVPKAAVGEFDFVADGTLLSTWAERVNLVTVKGKENPDERNLLIDVFGGMPRVLTSTVGSGSIPFVYDYAERFKLADKYRHGPGVHWDETPLFVGPNTGLFWELAPETDTNAVSLPVGLGGRRLFAYLKGFTWADKTGQ